MVSIPRTKPSKDQVVLKAGQAEFRENVKYVTEYAYRLDGRTIMRVMGVRYIESPTEPEMKFSMSVTWVAYESDDLYG
jgi:hypothetical protein